MPCLSKWEGGTSESEPTSRLCYLKFPDTGIVSGQRAMGRLKRGGYGERPDQNQRAVWVRLHAPVRVEHHQAR